MDGKIVTYLSDLTSLQQNVLIASILGDGEITKIYKNSRRKNNSYREHFSLAQLPYRKWKQEMLHPLLYFTGNNTTLRSKSLPLFTSIYHDFYDDNRNKMIPERYLRLCTNSIFLFVLYMDDGSLSITKKINHRLKRVYLTPHIYLYLQSFQKQDLLILQRHMEEHFNLHFNLNKRRDGFGYILRFTTTLHTFKFFEMILPYANIIPNMRYKTSWSHRFHTETVALQQIYPGYDIIASSSERNKPYSHMEIEQLIRLKSEGMTDKEIASLLNRSYWSVVYKWRDLKNSMKQYNKPHD